MTAPAHASHARLRFARFTLRLALIVGLLALAACDENRAAETSVAEVTGSRGERVARISAILAKDRTPPTAISDAHFLEEKLGDGIGGPSDYREFYVLQVAPQDVSKWTQILRPLEEEAGYGAPETPRDWWLPREAFASLQLYKPNPLTGRIHGWIGVSPPTGRIYIATFTM